jgi:hypothetical protein
VLAATDECHPTSITTTKHHPTVIGRSFLAPQLQCRQKRRTLHLAYSAATFCGIGCILHSHRPIDDPGILAVTKHFWLHPFYRPQ